jgi:hypothetical protein
MPLRSDFIALVRLSYQREKDHVAAARENALQQARLATPLFGYAPSSWLLHFGAVCAFLYEQGGDVQLAMQARDALLFYREWLDALPPGAESSRPEYDAGIPPIEPVFQPVVLIPAIQRIRRAIPAFDLAALVDIAADGLRPIWRFPEWGGHNRAMLRAAGLALAAQAFPDHPEAPAWGSLADELAEESWGRWSIEDAMMYQSHWLRALIRYAAARNRVEELRQMVQPLATLKAIVQLLSPLGILPDFGDSHWLTHSHWEWVACLEWGAGMNQNPQMKWAAQKIFEARQAEPADGYLGTVALLAWEWCDDQVLAEPPTDVESALDDLIQKKIVWRSGWDANAAYACLNYRDEGAYGRVARQYLRSTLAVSAEKMHHGHADEGSFAMLAYHGALLLHESGYRENPPDGKYRAAPYHNRLAWRDGRQPGQESLLAFLIGDGRYQPVATERLYHTHLGGWRFSRVRVVDPHASLVWDRSVLFLPELPGWIVVDGVLSTADALRTLCALWWTTDVLAQGSDCFETHLRGVQDWVNHKDAVLWIGLPAVPGQSAVRTVEPARRSFQDELALAHTWVGEHRSGQYVHFVSVLWPHKPDAFFHERAGAFEVLASQPQGRGIGLRMRWQGEDTLLCLLSDLDCGIGQKEIRPAYAAAQGMASYGPVASDAALVVWRQRQGQEWCGFINGTFLALDGQVRYHGLPHAMFQENRTALPGVPRRFRWESG